MTDNGTRRSIHATFRLSDALAELERFLLASVSRFRENLGDDHQTSASQWMLDNFYVVQRTLRQIREDMPPGFYRRLPTLTVGPLQGYTRIYSIARELVVDGGGFIDASGIERIAQVIRSYPNSPPSHAAPTVLTIAELWALPVMLRLCMVQCLSQAACHVTAIPCEGSLPAAPLPSELKDEQVVANSILSLRALAAQDWRVFFENVSQVEHILREDPAGVYAAMDTETRDRYRKVIEQLARATHKDEPHIASQVIALAQEALRNQVGNSGITSIRLAHVGYYLIDAGRPSLEAQLGYNAPARLRIRQWARRYPTQIYLGSITLISLIVLFAVLGFAKSHSATLLQLVVAGLLSIAPTLSITVGLVNWFVTLVLPPRVLPKMDFDAGIAPGYSTLVVIPALLSSADEVNSLMKQIELHYLRNADPNLSFALLTDFPDANQQSLPKDIALIEQAANGIRALNRKYPRDGARASPTGPFYLLHRERRWNASEGRWMGWERKRGKLQELNQLLRGIAGTSYTVKIGDMSVLPAVRYVITLDADTILLRQDAQRLAATLAHPLNQAEFGAHDRMTAGYMLLQPRIDITPVSASRSIFTRIFAGDVGLDLYSHAVSNVYQDLFGTGIYIGKGIYDVDAFERSLKDRTPENALLSHDLFEGIHGRVGLATDIILFEDYPPHYLVYMRRASRWIRGDWQLLPWLLPRVRHAGKGTIPNDLSVIDRWKILDNLRRSLLAPMLLLLFVASWLWLPGPTWAWTLFGILTPAAPLITGALSSLVRNALERNNPAREQSWRNASALLQNSVLRWLLELAFIPYETFLTLGGILITLVRVVVTHKNLLEWVTAAQAVRESGYEISWRVMRKRMMIALIVTAALAALIISVNASALAPAFPLLAAWLLSPEIAFLVSRPVDRAPEMLSAGQQKLLRKLARRTWLFFEQFVGPEDHWLPPDHFQESPVGQVTPQTSPTNIGLLMLSTLSAYDFGYIGLQELTTRLQLAFESLGRLERYRGHLLNWYDTRSMLPLTPRYISTVDSGNFAACLIALRQGLAELHGAPLLRWQFWEGCLDTLDMLAEVVEKLDGAGITAVDSLPAAIAHIRESVRAVKDHPAAWIPLLKSLTEEGWPELNQALSALVAQGATGESSAQVIDAGTLHRLHLFADRIHSHLNSARREIETLLPDQVFLHAPFTSLTLAKLPAICQSIVASMPGNADAQPHVRQEFVAAGNAAQTLLNTLEDIEQQSERYVQDMDFAFLFDGRRKVFRIGYNVEAARLDDNHYDLLASEARIASLVAIAKYDVPPSHWLHLGRALTKVNGVRCLLSWNATMFEYLMPALLMRSLDGTLLHESCRAAVQRQMAYGSEKRVPWGVSEAGFYAFDAAMNYQYRAFGVPGLGFKRELADDLVIAPYASLLALRFTPRGVADNIAKLIDLQMLGPHGFYESIDYTSSRMPPGESHAMVRSYMAHHQGMILISLINYLHGDVMVNRLHADPRIRSVEMLLQEKVPYDALLEPPQMEEGTPPTRARRPPLAVPPWRVLMIPPVPQAHFLSNGRYGTLLTSTGSGFSRWQNVDLTRWSPDTALESAGTWLYVQEELPNDQLGPLWSATFQPAGVRPDSEYVDFHPHMVEFGRNDYGIALNLRVTVAPDDDVEIRHVLLTNHGDAARRLRLSSYGEVVLAPRMDDQRHPAFSKLFIESEYAPDANALLFHRRPRSQQDADKPLYLAHCAIADNGVGNGAHASDRALFLGRGGTPQAPAALRNGGLQTSTHARVARDDDHGAQAPLDPIFSVSEVIELPPHGSAQVAFITLAADSRQKALSLASRYRAWNVIDLAFTQAEVRSRLELSELNLGPADLEQAQQLLSALLYPSNILRTGAATIAANQKGQNGLWAFGISGDNPILLLRLTAVGDLTLAEVLLRAHTYWRNRQIKIDLVILNQQGTTYTQDLSGALQRLVMRTHSGNWLNLHGGIFILNEDQLGEADRVLLETSASAIIDPNKGALASQLEAMRAQPNRLPQLMPTLSESHGVVPSDGSVEIGRPGDLQFDNGWGGFSADGREYVIYQRPGQPTPAPWVNVVANPDFGFIVSESGAGYTWAGNSSENRLTPWSNDPVLDSPGEVIYLRDEETVEVWSPTPAPCPANAPYLIRHGAGYSIFEHHSHDLKQRLRMFAAVDEPIKVMQLRLENTSARTRRITAVFYAEWVLGTTHEATQLYLAPEFDSERQAMLVRNPYSLEFGGRVAFAAASKQLHGLTVDRTSFLGRAGSLSHPDALQQIGLNGVVEPGLDPCVALQVHMDLQPGQSEEVYFLLGQGANRHEALQLVDRYRDAARVQTVWQTATKRWNDLLTTVQVRTPEPAMDLLLNRWLLYPTLACRVWGRSAFYQPGGAFGFRDQLQDVMALVDAAPHLAREHILRAAQYQFEAGDVLHWWHPPFGRGVRTRCSDDLLWLPFVTAHYVSVTGDESILSEQAAFLQAPPLGKNEAERYSVYPATGESVTLVEHCRRAIGKGGATGAHGFPLMGSGDWNDGMNRVGIGGAGESVWLGWFLYATLNQFADLCARIGNDAEAHTHRARANQLRAALEAQAWDGQWYLRAFYDDGTRLGSLSNSECQIDSVAQSWAALSGAGDPARVAHAMQSVVDRLEQADDRMLLLLAPPFANTLRDPGYIKGYVPGIRENGGQYTHAAIWVAWAFAALGDGDKAEALFQLLNPIHHADTRDKAARYRVEPYVIAADVYSTPPYTGRGGWTWYTGSNAWMYRFGLDAILGIQRRGRVLHIDPCIPKRWPAYEVTYRCGATTYEIAVDNAAHVNRGVKAISLDGQALPVNQVPLLDDGAVHRVQVWLGANAAPSQDNL